MIRVRLVAALAALALALVGCSDDAPDPKVDPTPSPTTSTSLTPTSEPTPTSTEAPRTPVQTVKDWVEARNVTLRDGGTTEVYALSSPDCSTCRDLVEPFAQLHADGGTVVTDGWRVDNARERPGFDENNQVIAALTFAGGHTELPGKGSSPFLEEKHILQFQLRPSDPGWLVAQVVFLP